MEAVGAAANIIAVVQLASKIGSILFQYSKDVKNARDDVERLAQAVAHLRKAAQGVRLLLESHNGERLKTSQDLVVVTKQAEEQLQKLDSRLEPSPRRQTMKRFGFRALKWPFQSSEAQMLISDIERCTQTMNFALQIDQTEIILNVEQRVLLDKLPVASGAAFDSYEEGRNPTCLPNTRVDLLQQRSAWADDSESEAIFWLNGMAGTGKSTISRTMARDLNRKCRLGASFFFKRGEGDRRNMARFVTSIAADIVAREPAISQHVKKTLEEDPGIVKKTLKEQFDKLIIQPFSKLPDRNGEPIVLVVDALDECENDDDIRTMIEIFSTAKEMQNLRLKTFFTSRPELPIRLGFHAIKGRYQDLILHDIPLSIIVHDLQVFLQYKTSEIRDDYNATVPKDRQLTQDRPGELKITSLVHMAVPLFIFAATTCRFLADRKCGSPSNQLETVLQYQTKSQESKLDATYLPVLEQQLFGLSNREKAQVLSQFRLVIGSIIILVRPLSTSALASILFIEQETVDIRLDLLHSVLSVPASSEEPVRLFHLSFRDFLLDQDKRDNHAFWIDERDSHRTLGRNCLTLMNKLKEDICDLRFPGTRAKNVSPGKLSTFLPPHLQYACLYWVYHISEAELHGEDIGSIHDFLKSHFLHWIEALSLMGQGLESIRLVNKLISIVSGQDSPELLAFLHDARRFVRTNSFAFDSFPLQLYSSALLFAPKKSLIRGIFQHNLPEWINIRPESDDDWGRCLQTFEGHSGTVNSVAFSPDSTLIASASSDKSVRVWNSATGECPLIISHEEPVREALFTPVPGSIATVSGCKVQLWHVETGARLQHSQDCGIDAKLTFMDGLVTTWDTYTGGSFGIKIADEPEVQIDSGSLETKAACLSQDAKWLAVADVKKIRYIHTKSGRCTWELQHYDDPITSMALSHNSKMLAIASFRCIWLLNVDMGVKPHGVFYCHTYGIVVLRFSHNSALLATGDNDGTITLWHTDTAKSILTLEGHSNTITSIVFSHDSTLLASASVDRTIRVWDVDTQEASAPSEDQSGITCASAFSEDLKVIASHSSSYDTIQLWDVATGKCLHVLKDHPATIFGMITFSPDSQLLASTSFRRPFNVWRVQTGERTDISTAGHYDGVSTMAFSPDSTLIACGFFEGKVGLWDVSTAKGYETRINHSSMVTSLKFSTDSNILVSVSTSGTIQIVGLKSDGYYKELKGHNGAISSFTLSNDSSQLVTGLADKTAKLWDVESGNCIQTFQGHNDDIRAVTMSEDSKSIISVSRDGTSRVWDASTGECSQIILIPKTLTSISFQQRENRNWDLITKAGIIPINRPLSDVHIEPLSAKFSGLGTSSDSSWITFNGKRLLWLPFRFRPNKNSPIVISDSTVAIGLQTGGVTIIGFRLNLPITATARSHNNNPITSTHPHTPLAPHVDNSVLLCPLVRGQPQIQTSGSSLAALHSVRPMDATLRED
uniref:Mitochondrial division protein 1 n=1 Tax=Bionectria ochroleuca TaxID=29856 RepID=A0A0B7K5Q0_BIOOC